MFAALRIAMTYLPVPDKLSKSKRAKSKPAVLSREQERVIELGRIYDSVVHTIGSQLRL